LRTTNQIKFIECVAMVIRDISVANKVGSFAINVGQLFAGGN
jgi:hypothetical protein